MATELWNEAQIYQSYEIIGGKKVTLPPTNLTHGAIVIRLYSYILRYLDANETGYVFGESTEVSFSDENIFRPDLVIVTEKNSSIIDWRKGINGVPDMVVEVLSKSTFKKDLTIKKDTYEANGVGEYWIVDPWRKSVSVYLLRDGKYFLDDEYILFDEYDLAERDKLPEDERPEVKHEVPVATLDGLKIPLNYIFKWGYK